MTTPSYITADDLIDAMGLAVFMSIFDDSRTPVGNPTVVKAQSNVLAILRRSLVQVSSFLPAMYNQFPPETNAAGIPIGGDGISTLLKDGQLGIALVYSYRRHPEYVKTYGAEPGGSLMNEWIEFMERVQAGVQTPNPNDSPPQTTPGNMGGFTVDNGARIMVPNADGSDNSGDF